MRISACPLGRQVLYGTLIEWVALTSALGLGYGIVPADASRRPGP